jgi:hypothetical protein
MLILIGLLILGGFAIYRIGWSEGYRVGLLTDGGVEGMLVPYAPYGSGFLGLLLVIGVFFLMFAVIGKFFRLLAWRSAGGPWMMAHRPPGTPGGPKGEAWAKHWQRHRHGGHGPAWCWDWEETSEEKDQEAEPEAGTGDLTAQV